MRAYQTVLLYRFDALDLENFGEFSDYFTFKGTSCINPVLCKHKFVSRWFDRQFELSKLRRASHFCDQYAIQSETETKRVI